MIHLSLRVSEETLGAAVVGAIKLGSGCIPWFPWSPISISKGDVLIDVPVPSADSIKIGVVVAGDGDGVELGRSVIRR